MMVEAEPRWHLRFANYEKALTLLRQAVASMSTARKARNEMAHEYSRENAEAIVIAIGARYLPLLEDLYGILIDERARGN